MNRLKIQVATLLLCASAGVGSVVGVGSADAAPRHTQVFPTVSSGVMPSGVKWTGFLLNKAQTRDAKNFGLPALMGGPVPPETFRMAAIPGRGAGCVVVARFEGPGVSEISVAYIRTESFATKTPDTTNARYWSTKNFRCA